jgi:hypothetical protein
MLASHPAPSAMAIPNRMASRHWQAQWETWQYRRLMQHQPAFAQARRAAAAVPSAQANTDIVAHRLRMFGGEVQDGAALCGPMLKVVMDLFDGGLDYPDP